MISNVEKGWQFQKHCKTLLESRFGRSLEKEVRITLSEGQSHKFDLATTERDIVVECKAYTWTKSGNTPSAKITNLREAVVHLNSLPDSVHVYLAIKRDVHPLRKETLASYFVRLNQSLLKRTNVFEIAEDEREIFCLNSSLQVESHSTESPQSPLPEKKPPLSASKLGELRRSLFFILDNIDGSRIRDEGPANRVNRLRSEEKLPKNIANLIHTILGFRNIAEYEGYIPTASETTVILKAWDAIVEWAEIHGYNK